MKEEKIYFDVKKLKEFFNDRYNKDTYVLKTDIINNGGSCHSRIVLNDENGTKITICECDLGRSKDMSDEELTEISMRFMFDDLLDKAYQGRLVKELSE